MTTVGILLTDIIPILPNPTSPTLHLDSSPILPTLSDSPSLKITVVFPVLLSYM